MFCEEISQLYVGGIEINVIKVEGIPCDGKLNFRWVLFVLWSEAHGDFCSAR